MNNFLNKRKIEIEEAEKEIEKESQREAEIQEIISIVKPFGNGSHLIVPKNFEGKKIRVTLIDNEIEQAKLQTLKKILAEEEEFFRSREYVPYSEMMNKLERLENSYLQKQEEFVKMLKKNKFVKFSIGETDDYRKGFLEGVKYMKDKIDNLSIHSQKQKGEKGK